MSNWIPKIYYVDLTTGAPKTITFATSPEGDPLGQQIKGDARTTETSNGNFQTQWNKNDEELNLSFRLVSYAITNEVEIFFKNHALKGGTFRYYKHSDETDYETYRMLTTIFRPIREVADANNDFFYNFSFKCKRTIALTYSEEDLGVGAISETQFDITDGASGADVDGLSVDDSAVGVMHVEFYIYRNTTGAGATERSSAGTLLISRNNTADDWEILQTENNYVGVDFDIDNTGQVTYTADTLTGTPDENYVMFRANVMQQGS